MPDDTTEQQHEEHDEAPAAIEEAAPAAAAAGDEPKAPEAPSAPEAPAAPEAPTAPAAPEAPEAPAAAAPPAPAAGSVMVMHGSYVGPGCPDPSKRAGANKGFGYDPAHPAQRGELVAGLPEAKIAEMTRSHWFRPAAFRRA